MNRLIQAIVLFLISASCVGQTVSKTSSTLSNNAHSKDTTPSTGIEYLTTDGYHFILHYHQQGLDSASYLKAANYFDRYDAYRFYDKRRTIYFTDKMVSIELFSAKELNEKYGKRISPYTIKDESNYPQIEFIYHNGVIKDVLK